MFFDLLCTPQLRVTRIKGFGRTVAEVFKQGFVTILYDRIHYVLYEVVKIAIYPLNDQPPPVGSLKKLSWDELVCSC